MDGGIEKPKAQPPQESSPEPRARALGGSDEQKTTRSSFSETRMHAVRTYSETTLVAVFDLGVSLPLLFLSHFLAVLVSQAGLLVGIGLGLVSSLIGL